MASVAMLVGGGSECPCVLGIKLLIHHFEKLWRRRRAQASRQSSRTAAGHTGVIVPEADRVPGLYQRGTLPARSCC